MAVREGAWATSKRRPRTANAHRNTPVPCTVGLRCGPNTGLPADVPLFLKSRTIGRRRDRRPPRPNAQTPQEQKRAQDRASAQCDAAPRIYKAKHRTIHAPGVRHKPR